MPLFLLFKKNVMAGSKEDMSMEVYSVVCSKPSRLDMDSGSSGSGNEIVGVSDKESGSSVSECSLELDMECGVTEIKLHLAKVERDCRICHMIFGSSQSGIWGFH